MKKKPKVLFGYILGAVLVVLACLPIWTMCSDGCTSGGVINIGLLFLGLGTAAMQKLSASKVPVESKRGCSMILLSFFLPLTLLGFALMVNFWYLLSLAGPALILGLVLLIVGIVTYTKSLK